MYKTFIKRILDFFLSLIGLIFLSPFFVFITIILFYANAGKPFFLQTRPGKNERLFKIIKFKTMSDEKDYKGDLLSDTERLTKVGKLIRKTSLDEIPQLLNVLKGDMSFIGPRPLLPEYLPYYSNLEKIRHNIKPGITGLAQINGRNNVNWDDRLSLDIKYVQNISLIQDLKILLISFGVVLFSNNVNIDPTKSMRNLNDERRNRSSEIH